MKNLVYILIFGLIFLLTVNVTNNKIEKKDQLSYKLEYYDNARVYKINVEKQKFHLLADFRKKQIA